MRARGGKGERTVGWTEEGNERDGGKVGGSVEFASIYSLGSISVITIQGLRWVPPLSSCASTMTSYIVYTVTVE